MTKRMMSLLVMVSLLIVPTLGLSAQGTTYCASLSDADCSQLNSAQEAMLDINSAGFTLDFSMNMQMPELGSGMDNIQLGMVGEGALAMDFGLFSGEADTNHLTDGLSYMSELVAGISGEASFEILVPAELSTPGMPELVFDLVMVNGVLYFDAGAMMGAQAGGEPFWMGFDLAELYGEIGQEFSSGLGTLDPTTFTNLENIDQSYVEQFVNVNRLANEHVRGSDTAVYQMSYDFEAIMQDETYLEAMEAYMQEYMQSFGMGMPDFSAEMIAEMYQDMNFSLTYWVGVNDNYIHRLVYDVQGNINSEMMGMTDMGNVSMAMNFDIELFDFNEPVNVIAPENAQILPTSMFTQGF